MKIAVISVTDKGARLAEQVAARLACEVDVYAKSGRNPLNVTHTYDSLRDLISENFSRYDGFVFIMAVGIVVRVIAPHIHDKRFDPAVTVMDDGGNYAISLLSGHIGGANDLTKVVGNAVGAVPVITTATDVARLPAADVLAVKLNLAIEPFCALKTINAAIVNGDKVAFFVDDTLADHNHYKNLAAKQGIKLKSLSELELTEKYDAAVIISDRSFAIPKPHLYLRPASLAVGVGCRRGATSGEILSAISEACKSVGRSYKSVAVIGSTVIKEDEIGLLAAAQQLDVPTEFFSNEQLKRCVDLYGLSVSKFVNEQIGVGNVCEPAAILAGQTDKLILSKTKYPKVTVAIAEVKYRWWE